MSFLIHYHYIVKACYYKSYYYHDMPKVKTLLSRYQRTSILSFLVHSVVIFLVGIKHRAVKVLVYTRAVNHSVKYFAAVGVHFVTFI